jgi:hypothetical protein
LNTENKEAKLFGNGILLGGKRLQIIGYKMNKYCGNLKIQIFVNSFDIYLSII